jgi:hypothetical protein
MKRIVICCLMALGAVTACHAQDAVVKPAEVQSYKAGGTPIAIPPPSAAMSEVGRDTRGLMDVFVASSNRLIAGFVLTTDLPKLAKPSDDLVLSQYAMVQVPRREEYMDCSASDFKEVMDGMRETFGDVISSSMKEAEGELNRRLKSLDLKDATVSLGEPLQLGGFFSKPDAYGFGMVMPVSVGGRNARMVMGGAIVRVRQRILFVYLYSEYKTEDTVKWLRKTTEEWVDAVLRANR